MTNVNFKKAVATGVLAIGLANGVVVAAKSAVREPITQPTINQRLATIQKDVSSLKHYEQVEMLELSVITGIVAGSLIGKTIAFRR